MKFFALLCTLAVIGASWGEKVRYDNHAVYKVSIHDEKQLSVVKYLTELTDGYNLWKPFNGVGSDLHIMVSPRRMMNFKSLMAFWGFQAELLIPNVQSLIDEEASYASPDGTFGWDSFHTLDEINAWLDEIVALYPALVSSQIIGKSYEGRDIRALTISYKTGNPGVFIESNIHAREWITSATVTYFINELLTSSRAEIINLRENFDWYIIPVLNVDGFVYTHNTDRMWRKTRQPVSHSECIGTDANRNFDSHWMENGGASANPCTETYAGAVPFSEPEAQALRDYVTSVKDTIGVYLSFHSYGQYLLCPYGHTLTELPTNYSDLLEIGKATADAVQSHSYGTVYTYGSTAIVLYVASGSSVDWVFNELGVKVGFTWEFRDKGRYGFVLPAVYIKPNAEETIEGLIAFIDKSKSLGYL